MSFPAFQTLQLERDGAVTWLRLNRPACLIALTAESFDELAGALQAIGADVETRVVVLTGNGRGFCAGSDIDGLQDRFAWSAPRQRERFEGMGRNVVQALHGLAMPTIAAINGPASGGGLSLALACDLRVASDAAFMRCGYTAIGLIPDLGATHFLPRVIGMSRACRLLWTNQQLTASEALAIGLVLIVRDPNTTWSTSA
jgi:2-(1,2-epoxy-1,2-dihydrophenyl)acetyl-CoA isomerase